MKSNFHSHVIAHISWGQKSVEGTGDGKDFKLWPCGGVVWDWREKGWHHKPGLLPIDIYSQRKAKLSVAFFARLVNFITGNNGVALRNFVRF